MPVRQYQPRRSQDHQQLVDRLTAEWRQPNPTAAEPVIIEEFNSNGDLAHVYVVWSDWRHIDRAERGQIIMEAADARHGATNTFNVTIAMGLTPDEADAMQLSWR
jgi:hypothetical protein